MESAIMSRWLTWRPDQIFQKNAEDEPAKPTKRGFDGFVGFALGNFQKIDVRRRVETLDMVPAAQDSWDWIEERAAIMEFDGGLHRHEANHRAFMLWYRRFVEGNTRQ